MVLYPTYLASYCQGLKVATPNIPISRLSPCNRARLLKSSSCRRHEFGHCASTHFKRRRNHFGHEMIDDEIWCWEWRDAKRHVYVIKSIETTIWNLCREKHRMLSAWPIEPLELAMDRRCMWESRCLWFQWQRPGRPAIGHHGTRNWLVWSPPHAPFNREA